MKSAKTLLEDVLQAYNDKSLDFAGAESLAAISGQFLDNVRASSKTSAADLLWAEALNVEADLEATLNKDAEALALARKAKEAALSLTRTNPNAQEPQQALYDASIRVGNALSGLGTAHYQDDAPPGIQRGDRGREEIRFIGRRRQGRRRRHRRAYEDWRYLQGQD